MTRARIPGLICLAVLICILAAGLAPFGPPRNEVTWLGSENGVRLGRHGTIWSAGIFPAVTQTDESCSIELWLQPGSTSASSTILAFYEPEDPLQLVLHQYHSLLILNREIRDNHDHILTIGTDGVFRRIEPEFITITSGADGSAMYVNGALARSFPRARIGDGCAGQLVVGTSPVGKSNWHGEIKGLAIYRQELAPSEVLAHFQTWTAVGQPRLSGDDQAIAVYLFDERTGNVIRNAVRPGVDLFIPERYSLLHEAFLTPFWKEFKPTGSYCADTLINILGFIPLGFVFYAYWSAVRPIRHAALTTVIFGFGVSLTIEVLQSYLPTRDSGTTDLITNTLGTFLGVRLWDWKIARTFLARIFSE